MRNLKDWTLTELAGKYVAVPTGDAAAFRGIVRLNESGRDIWEGLAAGLTDEQIAQKLVSAYADLTEEKALAEVKKVVDLLRTERVISE